MNALPDFSKFLHVSLPLECKFAGGRVEAGEFEGYAATFGGPADLVGDVVARGAFAATLKAHEAAGSMPALLWAHDPNSPIGRLVDAREDDRGLYVRGVLNLETEAGRRAHVHAKAGDVTGMSIGYGTPPGGRARNDDGTFTLRQVELIEVSLTAIPMNRRARVTAVKGLRLNARSELVDLLRTGGLSNKAAELVAAHGWTGLAHAADEVENPNIEQLARRLDAAIADVKSWRY